LIHNQLILVLGALLSSCLLGAAAAPPTTQDRQWEERSGAIVTLFRAVPTPVTQSTLLLSWPPAKPPAYLTPVSAATKNPACGLQCLFSAEVLRTPFVEQVRVTVVRLWGGRLQLGGFASTSRTENVLLSFSGSGGPALPGVRVPRANRSYGLSLTFRFGRDAHAGRGVE